MPSWIRFVRLWRPLKPNEVQAKIPMLVEPSTTSATKRTWAWIPVRDPEIYPLLLCVSTGFAMLALYNVHNVMENPDINLKKTRRETQTVERYHPEEAEKFTKHRTRFATLLANPVNTSEAFEPVLHDHHTPSSSTPGGGDVDHGQS